jgi:hypothetical protein
VFIKKFILFIPNLLILHYSQGKKQWPNFSNFLSYETLWIVLHFGFCTQMFNFQANQHQSFQFWPLLTTSKLPPSPSSLLFSFQQLVIDSSSNALSQNPAGSYKMSHHLLLRVMHGLHTAHFVKCPNLSMWQKCLFFWKTSALSW